MINVKEIRKQFKVYEKNPSLIYLDSSASSLKVDAAVSAVNDYYNDYGVNVHRGGYKLSYEATELYEDSRKTVSQFINANVEEIIFTKGATQALNIVANNYLSILNEGDEIIVSELEHHSSILPWINVSNKTGAKIVYVPLTKDGRITLDNFKTVITSKTKVVALTLASNVMGYITPMKDIISYARKKKDVIVVVDAAQAAPHISINVKDMDCDYLAFSGHKMYGPTGVGVLYGKQKLLKSLEPYEYGGEMVLEVSKEEIEYKSHPHKFEAGTPVIASAIGLSEAIKYIKTLSFNKIESHINEIHKYALDKLEKIEDISVYNKDSDLGIITFNVEGVHPHDIVSYLDQKDIAIRAGNHCAQLVSKFLNVNSTLRASFNIYNDIKDCDVFIESLIEAIDFFKKF